MTDDEHEELAAARGVVYACGAGCLLWAAIISVCIFFAGCFAIPVRAVPTDEPILVAPVGKELPAEDGSTALNPHLPQPDPAKFPPASQATMGWSTLGSLALTLVSVLLGGGAIQHARKARTALSIATDLADSCAKAETDEDVEKAKEAAAYLQRKAGVYKLTQKVRGKTHV